MATEGHNWKVVFPKPHEGHVYLDGEELHEVCAVTVTARVGVAPVLTLEVRPGTLEVEGFADVGYPVKVIIIGTPAESVKPS